MNMQDLSLHILDIAENSIEAQARNIEIRLEENRRQDLMVLEIVDDGKGMDEDMRGRAVDPFVTTRKTRRVGLGLPLLREAARAANGRLDIQSELGRGTRVRVTFQLSHIDMKPLGDMAQTIATLIMGHPEVNFTYTHKIDGSEYRLDTQEIKAQLDGIPIQAPAVIAIVKKDINEGLDQLRRQNEPRESL
jgi:anti-sigma regulatory factor (Ser/Thr protein kinase)